MGKRTFPALFAALRTHGLPDTTPAILAEAVSTPQQSVQRSNVHTLAKQLQSEIGDKPALVLFGPLAELGTGFDE